MMQQVIGAGVERAPKLGRGLVPAFGPVIVFAVVMGACLAGILLRPPGLLSSFWSANAVLLGLLVYFPQFASALGWIAAVAGYVLADLLTGSSLSKTLLLTAGNLAGVLTGVLLLKVLRFSDAQLARPHSFGVLLLVMLAASAASGLVGVVANPLLFNGGAIDGFQFWMVTEFANYIAVLPIVMVAPGLARGLQAPGVAADAQPMTLSHFLPLLTCVVSFIVAPSVGGVSALAVPVPGLVWCALSYSVSITALMSFVFAIWALVMPLYGLLPEGAVLSTHHDIMALRIGVSLVALTPVVIASAMTSRATALREATEARAAAEEAMAARSLLLATMAHELRTPLNAIVGLSTVLEMKPPHGAENPEHRELAADIRQGGLHLAELVTDLLDTAKVEAGETELSLSQVGSRTTIEQSLRLVAGLAMQSKVQLEITGECWPDVIADPRAIKQVMINVLSNAVKFSPRNSAVTISARQDGGRLRVSVVDSGPGISAEDLARLGRPYAQTAAGKARAHSTGLGLALSMNLIRKHGGELRLHSAPGEGTTVTFDLAIA